MNEKKITEKISRTQFSLFMRQLHILALVQHSGASENMNCNKMADLLMSEPGRESVTHKMVRDSVPKLAEMGFPVQMEQGSPRVWLERELSPEEMLEVLPFYLNVVTDTVGIRDCFKSYVENHGSKSLWIIARVYFASLQKKRIKLEYRSRNRAETEHYTLNPYRWIYRGEAVYLVAKNVEKSNLALFRLNRIKDLAVTGDLFNDDVPSSDELLKYSIGAFIGSRLYNVRLRFRPEERENIEEDFGHLEIKLSDPDKDGFMEASFTICDLINLCKTVFSFSGRVRIVEPKEAVEQMKSLLHDNLEAV